MPGFDSTGPRGSGPGTGGGRGPCGAGYRQGRGRGAFGWRRGGFGWGGGFCRRFSPFGYPGLPASGGPQDEAAALRAEEAYLKKELEAIQKRLAEVEPV